MEDEEGAEDGKGAEGEEAPREEEGLDDGEGSQDDERLEGE